MNRNHVIVGVVVGLLTIYLFGSIVVERKMSSLKTYLDETVLIKTAHVVETATVLGRGGANNEVATVVPECPAASSIRYDELLAALDRGLSPAGLNELSVLFNQCGDVAGNRRAGMALYLEQEVNALTELITLQAKLGDEKEAQKTIADWQELVRLEKEISERFSDLVAAQSQIITLLLSNVASSDISVENVRSGAQVVREELTGLTSQAAELRAALLST